MKEDPYNEALLIRLDDGREDVFWQENVVGLLDINLFSAVLCVRSRATLESA